MLLTGEESEAGVTEPSPELQNFWSSLPLARRRKLLRVDRKSIFTRIRQQFCSRCFGELASLKVSDPSPSRLARMGLYPDWRILVTFEAGIIAVSLDCTVGLFVLRYEEMKGAAALDCPACQEFYAGLVVSESGEIAVEEALLTGEPFTLFAEGKLREREREMQFMTGDICGSGFQKRPKVNMCVSGSLDWLHLNSIET